MRAVKRAGAIPGLREKADEVLGGIHFVTLDKSLLENAAELEPATLRSLDAIHLASALSIRNDLDVFISYDRRLQNSAAEHGIEVVAPA